MSKYKWNEMELCKQCHFKDRNNPDICHAKGYVEEKPAPIMNLDDCGRAVMESMWQRMPEKQKEEYRKNNNF